LQGLEVLFALPTPCRSLLPTADPLAGLGGKNSLGQSAIRVTPRFPPFFSHFFSCNTAGLGYNIKKLQNSRDQCLWAALEGRGRFKIPAVNGDGKKDDIGASS